MFGLDFEPGSGLAGVVDCFFVGSAGSAGSDAGVFQQSAFRTLLDLELALQLLDMVLKYCYDT